MAKRKKNKKLPWTGFEITRVKLDPEQAVLTCCNAQLKPLVGGSFQCDNNCPGVVVVGLGFSSS